MSFVVDSSVTLAWLLPGEATERTDSLMLRLNREEAHAPPIWPVEVANGFTVSERRSRTTTADTSGMVERLLGLPVIVEPADLHRTATVVLPLARAHRLTLYDAVYLDLAMRMSLPLATNDEALAAAARTAGVEVL